MHFFLLNQCFSNCMRSINFEFFGFFFFAFSSSHPLPAPPSGSALTHLLTPEATIIPCELQLHPVYLPGKHNTAPTLTRKKKIEPMQFYCSEFVYKIMCFYISAKLNCHKHFETVFLYLPYTDRDILTLSFFGML